MQLLSKGVHSVPIRRSMAVSTSFSSAAIWSIPLPLSVSLFIFSYQDAIRQEREPDKAAFV